MITIKRENTELKVSEEAFKLYFEEIGFKKVGESAKKVETEDVSENKKAEASKEENPKKSRW